MSKSSFLTYRVQHVPKISKEELLGFFYKEDRDDIKIKSLCPSVDTPEDQEGEYTATIFFRPHGDSEQEPRIAIDTIDIDKTFHGFTPLYVPKTPIAADIIAVTGLAGHAFGSWAHNREDMWIRDYLPRDVPNARMLTYGYPASLLGNTSVSTLQDYTATFVQNLIGLRDSEQCSSRPIIFIGHSLGCLLIKKALADIALMGVSSQFPVKTIIFLAAPHRGLNTTALQTLVKGKATEALVDELSEGSRTLNEISARFAQIASNIVILTCYETKPTKTVVEVNGVWQRSGEPTLMVRLDSAQLFFPEERVIAAETDHSQISKIRRGEGGIYNRVKSTIRQCLAEITKGVGANPERLDLQVSPSNHSSINQTMLVERSKHASEKTSQTTTNKNVPENNKYMSESTTAENYGVHYKCSSCSRECWEDPVLYSCSNCNEKLPDNFVDLCIHCKENGCTNATNSDRYHVLVACVMKDGRFQPAPEPKIDPSDWPIFKAIKSRDIHAVASLAKRSKSARDARNAAGDTPLHLAIQLEFIDVVEILLKAGVDPQVCSNGRFSALKLAIKYSHHKIVQILLELGADANEKHESEYTPLHYAVHRGAEECVRILLEHKAVVNYEWTTGLTPLANCVNERSGCAKKRVALAQLLSNAGADPNSGKILPLGYAAEKNDFEMIKYLLKNGASIDKKDDFEEQTALSRAARAGKMAASELLIDAGARVNITDKSGYTALIVACQNGHLDIAKQLLTKTNANVNRITKNRYSALTLAARYGAIEIVKLLIEHGSPCSPTPYSTWGKFQFNPEVADSTRKEILGLLRPLKHRKEGPTPRDPRLPKNWVRKVDKKGMSYYVDESTGTAHMELPKTEAASV